MEDSQNVRMSREEARKKLRSHPDIIVNSEFKQAIFAIREEVAKFDDPMVGYAVLFTGLDADYAKSIGIH